jgi:uncharacterized protein YlxP (DUF503 family)
MHAVHVAISQVHLIIRHARSLKDKRQVVSSIIQRLRNDGFSATECGSAEDPKQSYIGFSFAGKDRAFVEQKQQESRQYFLGDFQVGQSRHEIVEMSLEEGVMELSWEEEEFK